MKRDLRLSVVCGGLVMCGMRRKKVQRKIGEKNDN